MSELGFAEDFEVAEDVGGELGGFWVYGCHGSESLVLVIETGTNFARKLCIWTGEVQVSVLVTS